MTEDKKSHKKLYYLIKFLIALKRKILIIALAIVVIAIGIGMNKFLEKKIFIPKGSLAVNLDIPKPLDKPASYKIEITKKNLNEHSNKSISRNTFKLKSQEQSSDLIVKTEKTPIEESIKKNKKKLPEKNYKNSIENIDDNIVTESVGKKFQNSKLIPIEKIPASLIPKIAIVIDDLGIDQSRSAQIIKLKSPLTLSFLTYAPKLNKQTKEALIAGHELWMHMPMEPHSPSIDPGPNVLLTGLPKKELLNAIQWNMKQFNDYVGINNHMGSRFTSDLESIRIFMGELKKHNLMFLDSRTSRNSVAKRVAFEINVPYIERNIFIDHLDETEEIQKSLAKIEQLAKKNGFAVAIGHPRDNTLREVGSWLKTIESKGFQLVPLSKLIKKNISTYTNYNYTK